MNKAANIFRAKNTFYLSLILAAVLLVILAPKAAVNVDEQLHYPHAKKVVNWYFTGGEDNSCLDTPVTNLKYYGQSVDNLTALYNRLFPNKDPFLARHYTGAIFFWLLLLFAGLTGYRVTGSYRVAFFTVLSLLAMPRLFGQAFGNLKDIPFAAGYMAGVYMIIVLVNQLPRIKWGTVIGTGAAVAFTCSVRIGGLILFGYLGLAILAYLIWKPFLLKHIVSTKLCLVRLMGQGLTILIIGYFGGLLFWPYALQDVIRHPLESLQVMEHYKVSIRQLFEGNLMWSTDLPRYYLLKWLAISTPEFIFAGFLLFVYFLVKKSFISGSNQIFMELFLVFALLFPTMYVIAIDANLYSGVRQMLFILPVLAVLSSIGLDLILKGNWKNTIKYPAVLFFIVLLLLPVTHQAKTFPADYIYFNNLSGGNKKAWSNYEYDYYFHAIKKSAESFIEQMEGERVTLVSNCNLANYFDNHPEITFKYSRFQERSSEDWDYGIFGINYVHPWQLKNDTWQPAETIKTFYHRGNPVAIWVKRQNKFDYYGILASEQDNYGDAGELLYKAVKYDPNNVWLYVQMAKNCFKTNNFDMFDNYIEQGMAIHPFFEPLYLLKAQKYFVDKKYGEAMAEIEKLKEINPRYGNAVPLMEAVKKKINNNKIDKK